MRFGIIGQEFGDFPERGQGVLALHLQRASQQLPAETKVRVLSEQRAGLAFRFRVTARVVQRKQCVHVVSGGGEAAPLRRTSRRSGNYSFHVS